MKSKRIFIEAAIVIALILVGTVITSNMGIAHGKKMAAMLQEKQSFMSVLFLLVPLSLIIAGTFVTVCLVAIKKGQFNDMESPRWRILFDEKEAKDINSK